MPRTERALDEFDSLERVDANSHTHSTPIQTRLPPLSTPLRCVSLFPPECSAIVITANLFPIVMPTTFRYVWLMSRSRGINRASKLATKIARNYKRKSTFAPNSRREKAMTTFVSRSRIDNYEFVWCMIIFMLAIRKAESAPGSDALETIISEFSFVAIIKFDLFNVYRLGL